MMDITSQISLFYRTIKNILECRQPIDSFSRIIIGFDLIPFSNLQNDWESKLLTAAGRAIDIEVGFNKKQ